MISLFVSIVIVFFLSDKMLRRFFGNSLQKYLYFRASIGCLLGFSVVLLLAYFFNLDFNVFFLGTIEAGKLTENYKLILLVLMAMCLFAFSLDVLFIGISKIIFYVTDKFSKDK